MAYTQHHRYHITGLVLAAGSSTRMGGRNKLLTHIGGQTMLNRTLSNLKASLVEEIIVVLGHDSHAIRSSVTVGGLRFVHNPLYQQGMSTSLICGIDALSPRADGALICLADMPFVTPSMLNRLIAAYDPQKGCSICIPCDNGKRGNPVLWPATLFEEIRSLRGDVGARSLIATHEELICRVDLDDYAVLVDIDTPEDLKKWAQRLMNCKREQEGNNS
jgi:molybdenum cofactor cytidylyltransferase